MSEDKQQNSNKNPSTGRREVLKTLATAPVLGAFAFGMYKESKIEKKKSIAGNIFEVDSESTIFSAKPDGEKIRIGIIGFGIRGAQLMRALGFAHPEYIEGLKKAASLNSKDTRYQDFMDQDNLNIEITGVCDIFDAHLKDAVLTGSNINREGLNGKYAKQPKVYKNYQDLVLADDIDAVVIATPDHWHGTMAIAAAKAGKHVYLEKPMTWTVPETYLVKKAVEENNIVFQLGHQNRQIEVHNQARKIIDKGLIGDVSLIETSTNRNTPNGAWVYDIHPKASPKTIDWKQFEGDPERIKEYLDYMLSNGLAKYVGPEKRDKFSLERFFRWRCWWDYSTGLSGDLLTHEYDAMNQILKLGIPSSATSSGGVYFFKDGRTVPDVLQTTFEFSDRNLSMLYSATLASQYDRPRKIMGHDATMEIGNDITITVDPASTKYKDKIENGTIKAGEPFYRYASGKSIDAVSSATEMYFAKRGLLYSYVNGKRFNTTYLHLREWLECIRQDLKPSCSINEGFHEAITAHMGTRAYLEGRTMYWDKDKQEITRG